MRAIYWILIVGAMAVSGCGSKQAATGEADDPYNPAKAFGFLADAEPLPAGEKVSEKGVRLGLYTFQVRKGLAEAMNSARTELDSDHGWQMVDSPGGKAAASSYASGDVFAFGRTKTLKGAPARVMLTAGKFPPYYRSLADITPEDERDLLDLSWTTITVWVAKEF